LLPKVLGLLSEEERHLAEQRAQGRSWAELAAEAGVHEDALRKRLARAGKRVARFLGLEEVGNG
jgi:DNA-directed RNA polymerase specialized sigma24 family protein